MRTSPTLFLPLVLCLGAGCNGLTGSYSSSFDLSLEEARREETHALEIRADEHLVLDPGRGDVRVEIVPGSSAQLTATLVALGPDAEVAQQVLERYQVALERTDGRVTARAFGEPLVLTQPGIRTELTTSTRFDVRLPERVRLEVRTRSGTIEAKGPFGAADLRSGYGAVSVSGVQGDLRIDTRSGAIDIEDVRGDVVELESGYGPIRLAQVEGRTVRARSSSGRIVARDVTGRLELESGYGELEIEGGEAVVDAYTKSGQVTLAGVRGGPWQIRTGYGPVAARALTGELDVKTESGTIAVEGFDGGVRAETGYGSIAITGQLAGALSAVTTSGKVEVVARTGSEPGRWVLRSGYGAVELAVPEYFACDLEASTGYGKIESDFTLLVEAGRHDSKQMRAQLGGGGPTVELRTQSGDVHLKRVAP